MLLCTVRGCGMPLVREQRRFVCSNSHSFDVARSGYVNLLQPQDRRSRNPGDTVDAVAARRRLHDRGLTQPLLDAIRKASGVSPIDTVLDVGCGEGFYLGSLARAVGCGGYGIDISISAVDLAARRYQECQWIVANADRVVPYENDAFSMLLSITARMNAPEFRRVLQKGGTLLVAVPAPDDLIELRGVGRDRVPRTVEAFQPEFVLSSQTRVTTTAALDAGAIEDILHSIYRPRRTQLAEAMSVTLSLDLLRFC